MAKDHGIDYLGALPLAMSVRQQADSGTPTVAASPDMIAQLTLGQLFDSIAIQVDGPKAWHLTSAVDWTIDDTAYWSRLANGALTHGEGTVRGGADARITVARASLLALLAGATTPEALTESGDMTIDGTTDVLATMLGVLDAPARPVTRPRPEAEPVDLIDAAGGAVAKRVAPALAGAALLALLIALLRRRR